MIALMAEVCHLSVIVLKKGAFPPSNPCNAKLRKGQNGSASFVTALCIRIDLPSTDS
jgi:hypothetical protein